MQSFESQVRQSQAGYSNAVVSEYRKQVEDAMLDMGARKEDLNLVTDAIIRNALRNHRDPEDVAWAILQ